jgi:S-(hydroxymethyl)glutathione dehydrogenase/alcohol dehydrogenase
VPYANNGPRKVQSDFTDEQLLFLTDILPTGYADIDWAEPKGGKVVAHHAIAEGCGDFDQSVSIL